MRLIILVLLLCISPFFVSAKKPAHTYNRIGIDTGSASGNYEGTSKSDPLSGSLSGAHYIWRTEGGFTYGFVYHQIDVKGSVTSTELFSHNGKFILNSQNLKNWFINLDNTFFYN